MGNTLAAGTPPPAAGAGGTRWNRGHPRLKMYWNLDVPGGLWPQGYPAAPKFHLVSCVFTKVPPCFHWVGRKP